MNILYCNNNDNKNEIGLVKTNVTYIHIIINEHILKHRTRFYFSYMILHLLSYTYLDFIYALINVSNIEIQ